MNVSIKKYKHKLIENLSQSEKKYFSGLVNMCSKNVNEIWKIIKAITCKKGKLLAFPIYLRMLMKRQQVSMI